MLADDRIAAIMPDYYEASYSGMAAYYRDYLYANGTLSALEAAGEITPEGKTSARHEHIKTMSPEMQEKHLSSKK